MERLPINRREFLKRATGAAIGLGLGFDLFNPERVEAFKMPEAFISEIENNSDIKLEDLKNEEFYIEWLKKRDFFKERQAFTSKKFFLSYLENYEKEYPFWHQGRKLKLSEDPMSDENLLTRVMLSEEGWNKENILVAGLVGQTVINRIKNMQLNGYKPNYKKIVLGTEVKEFGRQTKEVPYSSDVDPLSKEHEFNKDYRMLAQAMLEGNLEKILNYGQTHFMHIATQNQLRRLDPWKYYSAETKHIQWLKNGMHEVIIPGINPKYIRFYIETHGPYQTNSENLSDNALFVMPTILEEVVVSAKS